MEDFIAKAQGVPFKDRGRDFAGWDCWGLIWRAYRDAFGLDLPCLANVPALKNWEAENIYDLIHRQHKEVRLGGEQLGDVAVFRGTPIHVGLVIQPGLMLHVYQSMATCVESYRGIDWKNKLIGIYRHVEFASHN